MTGWLAVAMAARYRGDVTWIHLLLPVGIAALVAWGWYAAARRRRELAAWAASRGLDFQAGKFYDLDSRYPGFGCLRQGHSRYGYNLILGRWGEREMVGFDYHYVTGSGKHRQTHLLSAVIVDSPVVLQPLFIRPEGFFDKVTEFFGADDIDFESAEFSRQFYVKATNKRWAYDVIHARAMEFLLAAPRFNIQFDLRRVACYRNRLFSTADFEAACQVAAGLLDRLPEYVVRQQNAPLGRGGGMA